MMKKTLVLLLSAVMLLNISAALGQEAPAVEPRDPETLVVGNVTMMNGNFFSDLWGNNSADIDVRTILHEYPLVSGRTREITRSMRSWSARWKHRHRGTETGCTPLP